MPECVAHRSLQLDGVSYAYPGAESSALSSISFTLHPGEVVALVGTNGAGKSTLARLLIGTYEPDEGKVLLDGSPCGADDLHRSVGFVRQDPESQLVSSVVWDEVAFGPCNLGLPADEVRSHVADVLAACGLEGFERRGVSELSGGELQRVALAGVLAMNPSYLVLDEATSQLDSASRVQVRAIVRELANRGVGVAMVTHDLEEVMAADRVVELGGGRVAWEGAPGAYLGRSNDAGPSLFSSRLLPALSILMDAGYDPAEGLGLETLVCRVRTAETRERVIASLDRRGGGESAGGAHPNEARGGAARDAATCDESALTLRNVTVSYGSGTPALNDASLACRPGRVLLVAGRSGSGKSTAARVTCGVLAPQAGEVLVGSRAVRCGDVGLCQQRAEDQLFCDTVLEDVGFGPRNLGLSRGEAEDRAQGALGRLGIDESLWDHSPFALSGGQRRRVALAGIVALQPLAYVLDEPTVGLDAQGRGALHRLVRELADEGHPVLVVSHDLDEWLEVADDAALIRNGAIVWSGRTQELVDRPALLENVGLVPPLWVRLRCALRSGRWGGKAGARDA